MRDKPLSGIRVLDLSRLIPGPLATLHLADLGADVIKVEDTGAGDYMRWSGADPKRMGNGYLALNRNKRSVALNLKDPEDVAKFKALVKTADAVLESFRPGVMDKLGVGWDVLSALNPRLVMCSISGYGQDGPYRLKAGHDINYIGYAGILDQTGARGGPPALSNFQIGDLVGGSLSAAMGMLAALLDAQRTGRGRYVDVSMTDCAMAHAVVPLSAVAETGSVPTRGDDRLSGTGPYYTVYECSDGKFFAVGALEPKFWTMFCEAIDMPELIETQNDDGLKKEEMFGRLEAMFKQHPRDHWTRTFADIDACLSPVLTFEEAMENEQIASRGLIRRSPRPDGDGEVVQYAMPIRFSEYSFSIDRPAPTQGEHNDEVLGPLDAEAAE